MNSRRAEYEAPRPQSLRCLHLDRMSIRKGGPNAAPDVPAVAIALTLELALQPLNGDPRQRNPAVLRALPSPHDDLVPLEIHVFHSQAHDFADAQSRSVHQQRTEPRSASQLSQNRTHFRLG